jgi:hypothetical protein
MNKEDNMKQEKKSKRKVLAIPPSSKVYSFLDENPKKSPTKLFEKLLEFYEENREMSKRDRAHKLTEATNEKIREIFPGENDLKELQGLLWVLIVRAAEGRYDARKIILEINENLIPKMESIDNIQDNIQEISKIQFSNISGTKKGISKEFLAAVEGVVK